MKRGLISFGIAVFAFLVLTAFVMIRANDRGDVPQVRNPAGKSAFLCDYLSRNGLSNVDMKTAFPYDAYLDSGNVWNIRSLKKDIACMDADSSLDGGISRQTLSAALTTHLGKRMSDHLNKYRPDSLLMLLQWAECFRNYAEADPKNEILFESVYNYWMDTIGTRLERFADDNPGLKYDFKYRYIRSRLVEKKFSPPLKFTDSEKFFAYFIDNRWSHMVQATWNQTSIWQKITFLIFFVLILYGFYNILIKTMKYFKHD